MVYLQDYLDLESSYSICHVFCNQEKTFLKNIKVNAKENVIFSFFFYFDEYFAPSVSSLLVLNTPGRQTSLYTVTYCTYTERSYQTQRSTYSTVYGYTINIHVHPPL